MWVRSELKDRAKWVLKQCYWKAVLVSFILAIVSGGGSTVGTGAQGNSGTREFANMIAEDGGIEYITTVLVAIIGLALFIVLIVMAIGIVINIFLLNPLEVNAKRFFIISRVQPAELNELGFSFKNSYMNVVKVQFLRNFLNFLWYLLLIVPGIIKSYEYRMMPYILAEKPDMDSSEVFQISKDMMYGEKWDTFVLDLSFIGWNILNICTCNLLAIFYLNPYKNLTNAELYDVLKRKLFNSGSNDQEMR